MAEGSEWMASCCGQLNREWTGSAGMLQSMANHKKSDCGRQTTISSHQHFKKLGTVEVARERFYAGAVN